MRASGQCLRQGQRSAVFHLPDRTALYVHFDSQDDPGDAAVRARGPGRCSRHPACGTSSPTC
eukprot:10623868-Alexandrium_andersonii.AAC.1